MDKHNFKCKKCGCILIPDGKTLGTNLIFFMCLDGCGDSLWIDIKMRIDQQGRKYET